MNYLGLFLVIALFLGTTSCDKDYDGNQIAGDDSDPTATGQWEFLAGLSSSDMDEIAYLHNESLKEAFADASSVVSAEAKLRQMEEYYSRRLELYGSSFQEARDNTTGQMLREYLGEDQKYIAVFENLPIQNISSLRWFKALVDERREMVIQEIDDAARRNVILLYLAVIERSAEFWLPKDRGGLGYIDAVSTFTSSDESILRSRNWRSVLAADGAAAATGFLSTAIFLPLASTPPGAAVTFGRIGFGAAAGSMWRYFSECF